jgi:crossover junction endodeoxyribonuclease RusA
MFDGLPPPQTIEYRLFVPGQPVPQGSKNAFVNPRTHRAMVVDVRSADLKSWRNLITTMALDVKDKGDAKNYPTDKYAVKLDLEFLRVRPRSAQRYVVQDITGKDVDKLARAVLDALTGVFYADDKQVMDLHATRQFSSLMQGVVIKATLEYNINLELSRRKRR